MQIKKKSSMQFETYPFEKLDKLLADVVPNPEFEPLTLTIGEPQFETPKPICDALCRHAQLLKKYPKTAGETLLKEAIRRFVSERFDVTLQANELLSTFGTREVLFNFPQFYLADLAEPMMAYTNPFYQIYEGAAIASKSKVLHLNLLEANGFLPEIDETALAACDLVILNFPNNPTASVMPSAMMERWVELALKYDFVLLNDECYSEIYTDAPPPSLLQASVRAGNTAFKNMLVVNSISKRSSAPGLRSGFIAGDATILQGYARYRTYVGCAVPLPLQMAAAWAWDDEAHVENFRRQYRENFKIAREILGAAIPDATFYLWLKVGDEAEFTRKLYARHNVKVLPGSFLGREGIGRGYVRIALVESQEKTREAMQRIKSCLEVHA